MNLGRETALYVGVGIGKYDDEKAFPRLKKAVSDAEGLRKVLVEGRLACTPITKSM